jgi:hypothetical protein
MRKSLRLFAITLACVLWVNAQEKGNPGNVQIKPDFSGSWLLDPARSNVGVAAKAELPFKITHLEPKLTITRQYEVEGRIVERDFVYYTDGRGETNTTARLLTTNPSAPSGEDKQVIESKSRWSGQTLVTRSALRSAAFHTGDFDVFQEWKLSNDGKTLTQTSRFSIVRVSATQLLFRQTLQIRKGSIVESPTKGEEQWQKHSAWLNAWVW